MRALLFALVLVGLVREPRRKPRNRKWREPDLAKVYRRRLANVSPGDYEFELTLLRGRGRAPVKLGPLAESFEWADEQASLTGAMTLRRPDPTKAGSLPVKHGYLVRCRVRWGRARWYELWRMRITKPPTVTIPDGSVTFELADDLALLKRVKRDWAYRSGQRRHKHGWWPHDIARDVARREGLKLGRVTKGKKRIRKLVKKQTHALDVLREAYKDEKDDAGRQLIVRMRNGRVEIVPMERNPVLYILARQIQQAVIEQEQKENPPTIIVAKGRVGKGSETKKLKVTVMVRRVVEQLGAQRKEVNYGKVRSHAELARKAKRDLAKGLRVKLSATVTHAGIPFIRRGEGVELDLPAEGFRRFREYGGERRDTRFVFVTGARHSVVGGVYTSDFELASDDPFLEGEKKVFEKRERERKRRERRRRRRA